MRKSKINSLAFIFIPILLFFTSALLAQVTFPVNGVADQREPLYAFIHATIVQNTENTLEDATLLIQKDKILAIGKGVNIPDYAIVVDCKGKFIYPSFIDIYSNYGVPEPSKGSSDSRYVSNSSGPLSWNSALKPQVNSVLLFKADDKSATPWREAGFGTVLTHQHDGIARGTGLLVTLADASNNLVVLKEKASAQYSFSKGTSQQSYPTSRMGAIALLRQTYINAAWYKNLPPAEGKNLSLEAWNNIQSLPQIFEANDKWDDLRAYRVGKEFGVNYIIKGGGNEYQRIKEIAATKATYILPLDFPKAPDVSNPNDARYISLNSLEDWEMAPGNPAAFEKAGIPFCLTTEGLKGEKDFRKNLLRSIDAGLSEKAALKALTETPAKVLNAYDLTGSLEKGKLANFIITDQPVFKSKAHILQNWIQGSKYEINETAGMPVSGTYILVIQPEQGSESEFTLEVTSSGSAKITKPDKLDTKFSYNGKLVEIAFSPVPSENKGKDKKTSGKLSSHPNIRLNGVSYGEVLQGNGTDSAGNAILWKATLVEKKSPKEKKEEKRKAASEIAGKVTFPFGAYGWDKMPVQQDILIKNATVWTCEKEGVLENTDVFVKNGKIAAIGKNLSNKADVTLDGTDMHLTPGIVDEHSHIATASINEGGQSVTSEVRIGDNLNPDDINIYRQLSGGVTTSHILHGSANTIGGQTQLIKHRWGVNDTALKFQGAPPFIKFALGENVKRRGSPNNDRFPNTRMGVEEVLKDAFTRARDYENAWKAYNNRAKNSNLLPPRRDLELDALVEIMNEKRFITCHSYVQSEILSSMKVADEFGFHYNTFTHVLEGYKVAKELKAHGANASTFSDWFNYKREVVDAIPQNASILTKMGINTAINSDDAEMGRRLNQEAAKSMKYGLTAEQALNMVTINPATMLHVQDRIGSIKVGKDADLVLWNHEPLGIYAVAQTALIDGIIYFDRKHDLELRKIIKEERNRLIQKINGVKKSGDSKTPHDSSKPGAASVADHHDASQSLNH